jgi:thiosulfate/3-mercaptopyruvate sulfurtransferase
MAAEQGIPEPVVTTEWLADNLGGAIKVVEVDEDTEAYSWGHIAGATALNWQTEMQDQVRRELVSRAGFELLMGARGIGPEDTVILYGGNNNWFAAYAYWLFKLYGHRDVRLLDGGRKKWELEERPLTSDVPNVEPRRYEAQEPDPRIRAFRQEVIESVGAKPMIDVRSPDEFTGKIAAPPHLPQEQAQRRGHIPGAHNVPWSRAAREDGSFRSADELRELYLQGASLQQDQETIVYCRIGERAAHTWFVLHELLGFPSVKNYDGSWTEYGSLVGVPVERDHG